MYKSKLNGLLFYCKNSLDVLKAHIQNNFLFRELMFIFILHKTSMLALENACATSENNAIYSGSFSLKLFNKKYFAAFVTVDNTVTGLEKKNPVN